MAVPNIEFSYRVIRSRRKTATIQITPSGEVLVRCPVTMPESRVRQMLAEKANWIRKHLPQTSPAQPFSKEQMEGMRRDAALCLPERVAHFAPLVGVSYGRITVRSQHTLWGSCSGKGNLNFNCLLMLTPDEVIDYVVVHELCHRKHMNHSGAFWAEVERILPEYRETRLWLKNEGRQLIARLP